jgi:septal ring factor EnvC (AmiA/AmiB activator)
VDNAKKVVLYAVVIVAIVSILGNVVQCRGNRELNRAIERSKEAARDALEQNRELGIRLAAAQAAITGIESALAESEAEAREARKEARRIEEGIAELEAAVGGSADVVGSAGNDIDAIERIIEGVIDFLAEYAD